jgi:hypothetical protein
MVAKLEGPPEVTRVLEDLSAQYEKARGGARTRSRAAFRAPRHPPRALIAPVPAPQVHAAFEDNFWRCGAASDAPNAPCDRSSLHQQCFVAADQPPVGPHRRTGAPRPAPSRRRSTKMNLAGCSSEALARTKTEYDVSPAPSRRARARAARRRRAAGARASAPRRAAPPGRRPRRRPRAARAHALGILPDRRQS